jgi:hypothetical protein
MAAAMRTRREGNGDQMPHVAVTEAVAVSRSPARTAPRDVRTGRPGRSRGARSTKSRSARTAPAMTARTIE